jgi:hypothetical protein
MPSDVAMPKVHLMSVDAPRVRRTLRLLNLEGATSAIIWLSYCGLVSTAIAIMSW